MYQACEWRLRIAPLRQACLGESCVLVVDVFAGKVVHVVRQGLNQPQGVLWAAASASGPTKTVPTASTTLPLVPSRGGEDDPAQHGRTTPTQQLNDPLSVPPYPAVAMATSPGLLYVANAGGEGGVAIFDGTFVQRTPSETSPAHTFGENRDEGYGFEYCSREDGKACGPEADNLRLAADRTVCVICVPRDLTPARIWLVRSRIVCDRQPILLAPTRYVDARGESAVACARWLVAVAGARWRVRVRGDLCAFLWVPPLD
jgi:hypothetical protein